MSDYDELFNESNSEAELPKKLRKVIDEKDAALKEVQKELNELRSAARQQTLSASLADRGLNPKVAKFIPADVEDIDGWLAENGDVFGGQPAPQKVEPSEAEVKVAQFEGEMDQVQVSAPADIESKIKNATSIEDLQRLLGQR